MEKKFISLEKAQFIIDGLEIIGDELFELKGGVAADGGGRGCGCECNGGGGCGCGCNGGSGCGCGCGC
ncbi:MAG: hypothetical protein LBP64_07090 [Tannerella sp.]|nr:hypothetical protein [Tannerella sp.]